MFDGKDYNGRRMEDVQAASGCPKGDITAIKGRYRHTRCSGLGLGVTRNMEGSLENK